MAKKGTLVFKRVKPRKLTVKARRLIGGKESNESDVPIQPINLREQNVDRIDNVGHFMIDANNNDIIYLYPKYMGDNQPLIPLYVAPNEPGRKVEYDKPNRTLVITYNMPPVKKINIPIIANDA